jgi:hypothetical protein
MEMFRASMKNIDKVGRLIGCDIFEPNFTTKNVMFIIMMFDLITYLLISFQNIYAFREDFVRVVFCIVTLGMGFQGSGKIYTFIFQRKNLLKLGKLAEKFQGNSNDKKSAGKFEKWILNYCHVGSFTVILFCVSGFVVFCYPFIFYLIVGKKILHFGFMIPGLNWETPHGYTINFIHHTYQIFIVVSGTSMTTLYILFFLFNAFAQYDALKVLLDNLNFLAVSNKNHKNDEKIKICIADITNGHVELIE